MNHIYGLPPGPYWPAFHPCNDQCEATGKIQREVPGGLRDVCRVVFDQTLDDGAAHKTLQLFAAAPELLEACKYALARFTHGPEAITNPNDAIVDDLRAAIAKAEGRTQ